VVPRLVVGTVLLHRLRKRNTPHRIEKELGKEGEGGASDEYHPFNGGFNRCLGGPAASSLLRGKEKKRGGYQGRGHGLLHHEHAEICSVLTAQGWKLLSSAG